MPRIGTSLVAASFSLIGLAGCTSSPLGAWTSTVDAAGVEATYALVVDEQDAATLTYEERSTRGETLRRAVFVGDWSGGGDVDLFMDLSCGGLDDRCAPFGRSSVRIACQLDGDEELLCAVQGSDATVIAFVRDEEGTEPASPASEDPSDERGPGHGAP